MKEYKVGEKFEIEGVEYVCKVDTDEVGCDLCEFVLFCSEEAFCSKHKRSDGLDIHFEKVNP